jgi:hypothetical protein
MKHYYNATEVHAALDKSMTKHEFQRVLCIWLKISFSFTSKEIASAIGWTPPAVRRLQSLVAKHGTALFYEKHKGGRRHAYLSLNRETQIISKFVREVRRGSPLDIQRLRTAYELSVGKPVSLSTIYRLIDRHGLTRFLPKAHKTRKD